MNSHSSSASIVRYEKEIEDLWRLSRAVVFGIRGLASTAETFQPTDDDFAALVEIAERVDQLALHLRGAVRGGE